MHDNDSKPHAAAVLLAACAGTEPITDDMRRRVIDALGEGFVNACTSRYLPKWPGSDLIDNVKAYAVGRLSHQLGALPTAPDDLEALNQCAEMLIAAVIDHRTAEDDARVARLSARKAGDLCLKSE